MTAIPLQRAYLCVSCDAVTDSAIRCPRCASEALLCLQRVLDRKPFAPAIADTLLAHALGVKM